MADFELNPITGELDLVKSDSEITTLGDARYLKINQTTPQSITGLNDGVLALKSGVLGTTQVRQFTYFV